MNLSGVNGNVIMSGWKDDNPDYARRQNRLLDEHIEKIVSTYQFRNEEPRYSPGFVGTGDDFNLNISRYISTAVSEEEIDLGAVNAELG